VAIFSVHGRRDLKTLVVTSRAPDARGKGDAKAADRTIRALQAAGHEVTTLALSPTSLAMRLANTMSAAASGKPLQIGFTHSSETAQHVSKIAHEFDLVLAVHARAAAVIPAPIRPRSFAFIIDAYGQNYSTYAPALRPGEREVYRFEAARMRQFELLLAREFGGISVVSEYDRAYLINQGASPEKVFSLPGGADVEHFSSTVREPDPIHPGFVFIGRLNYVPNRDAIDRLLSEIWPAIRRALPHASLRIVGAQPGSRLRRSIETAGATLSADVPDVRDEMRHATALLVPVRMGGGIQSKILEAMAARLPVVCSRFANLGISATPDEHVLIAESAKDYVRLASHLVSDPSGAKRLADTAYTWVSTTQSQAAFTRHLLESVETMLQRTA
jgi:glycosyltransferase involved in cell wall biosynthesis